MKQLMIAVSAAAIIAAACGGGGQPTTADTPIPTSTAVGLPGPTRDQALNRLIASTLDGDKRALLDAVGGTKMGCVHTPDGLGHPPICRAEEPEGKLVDAFGVGGCDGLFVRTEEAYADVYESPTPARLFAVGAPRNPGETHADYLILFTDGVTGAAASRGFMWEVRQGKIVGFYRSCNDIRELLAFVSPGYLVAPPP